MKNNLSFAAAALGAVLVVLGLSMFTVDQRQFANAAACERLHHPRTHTANANDSNMRHSETRQCSSSVEPPDAAKALGVGFIHSVS